MRANDDNMVGNEDEENENNEHMGIEEAQQEQVQQEQMNQGRTEEEPQMEPQGHDMQLRERERVNYADIHRKGMLQFMQRVKRVAMKVK